MCILSHQCSCRESLTTETFPYLLVLAQSSATTPAFLQEGREISRLNSKFHFAMTQKHYKMVVTFPTINWLMYRSFPKPHIPPLPAQTPGHLTFIKNFGQIPRYVACLDSQLPHSLELQRGSNRLFKCTYFCI